MKYFTALMLLALPFVLPGQITNFKKIKKFGLDWIEKTQLVKHNQTVLLNENSFISEIKGAAKIERVGVITQVTPTSTETITIIWCSLVIDTNSIGVFHGFTDTISVNPFCETHTLFEKTIEK